MTEILQLPRHKLSETEVDEFAALVRTKLNWGEQLQPSVVKALEHQIPQLVPSFQMYVAPDQELHGNRAKTEFDPLLVTYTNTLYKEATGDVPEARFDAIHELGHALLHCNVQKPKGADAVFRGPTSDIRLAKFAFRKLESDANRFARALLLPSDFVRKCSDFLELAELCAVPERHAKIRFSEVVKKPLSHATLDWIEEMKRKHH